MAAHRQDVTDGQDMIVAQDPADREGWSGSMEEVMSFPSGSATTAPIDECRLPCGLCGPIELGLGSIHTYKTKMEWMEQRLGRPFSPPRAIVARCSSNRSRSSIGEPSPWVLRATAESQPTSRSRSDLITLGRAILASLMF